MAGHSHNGHRWSGDQAPDLFLAAAINPQSARPRPQQESQHLECRLCRAGGFGRIEHQASAVVGVVLVGIAIAEQPLPLLQDLRPLRQHQQLRQNGIIAQARATPQRENKETGCRMLYRVLAHGFQRRAASLPWLRWFRFSPPEMAAVLVAPYNGVPRTPLPAEGHLADFIRLAASSSR